ncbi:MAG: AMP-binding protein, partial [Verrucomicrobiae bacterium]|nr:AMP-binding protein [Verrucomicrobiae bacterium]
MSSSPVQPPSDFAEFPRSALEGSLARRFRERAVRFPDAIAVKSGRDSLTYSQLDLASDALARDLIEKDGRDPLPIGTWMAPGCELVTAALAILKAGKIWVPIDPAYPQARAEWMLRDSGARLRLDSVDLGSARASDAIDLGGPDAIAYILYTSGSTGEPRGVFQNHRNVLHSIRAHANALKISPSDRLTLLASCSHLAGVTAIFRALLCGARVLPYDLKKDGVAGLAEWIEREGVTLYQSVPLVFRHLVETLRPARRLQGVRLVHLGGETVLRRDVESFRRHFSENAVLLNNLGSTEVFTYRQLFITRGTPLPDETVPVGDAVEEKDVTLRDEDGRRVPAGAAGEIWVSSPYLAPGYWNRPDWTAEKFLSDPERPGWRIFKTGDLGRILPDGRLAHLGRKDSQVKIRGHRLELDEVARALLRHPAIEDQAVLAAGSGEHDRVLLAFVVLKTGGALTAAALRSFLGERLPDFMVPSVLEFLESLPRTPNGKVDRQALLARPRRSESRDVLSGAFRDAPLDDREEKVLGAFREILGPQGGPQVGPLDEFLEIGGDSLSASRIVALLNETFSVRLPLSFLFEHSTARRVSNALEAQPRSAASANPTSAGTRDEGPLSLSQQRLWLLHQLDPASSVYHLAKAARIHGPLDRRALENALAEVRRRHAILRTIFPSRDGQPYQKVLEPGPPLTFVEFESSESAHDDRVDSWMRDHFAAPFDLALGPLFRAAILSAGPEDHVLLLTMHHLVADGWSMSVLWRELSLL